MSSSTPLNANPFHLPTADDIRSGRIKDWTFEEDALLVALAEIYWPLGRMGSVFGIQRTEKQIEKRCAALSILKTLDEDWKWDYNFAKNVIPAARKAVKRFHKERKDSKKVHAEINRLYHMIQVEYSEQRVKRMEYAYYERERLELLNEQESEEQKSKKSNARKKSLLSSSRSAPISAPSPSSSAPPASSSSSSSSKRRRRASPPPKKEEPKEESEAQQQSEKEGETASTKRTRSARPRKRDASPSSSSSESSSSSSSSSSSDSSSSSSMYFSSSSAPSSPLPAAPATVSKRVKIEDVKEEERTRSLNDDGKHSIPPVLAPLSPVSPSLRPVPPPSSAASISPTTAAVPPVNRTFFDEDDIEEHLGMTEAQLRAVHASNQETTAFIQRARAFLKVALHSWRIPTVADLNLVFAMIKMRTRAKDPRDREFERRLAELEENCAQSPISF